MSADRWKRIPSADRTSLLEPMYARLDVCERSLITLKRIEAHHYQRCVWWAPTEERSREWHCEQAEQARRQLVQLGREARALEALLDLAEAP